MGHPNQEPTDVSITKQTGTAAAPRAGRGRGRPSMEPEARQPAEAGGKRGRPLLRAGKRVGEEMGWNGRQELGLRPGMLAQRLVELLDVLLLLAMAVQRGGQRVETLQHRGDVLII